MSTELIGITKTENYSLYHVPFVVANHSTIIKSSDKAYTDFRNISNSADSTWSYNRYNIFSLRAGDHYYYTLYQCIASAVRDRIGDNRPLWMQCWLNYHLMDEVLDWHWHSSDYIVHGYLSIDPKHTCTEFREFTIENKIGNLYVGTTRKGMDHRVVVKEPYEGYRITIAFDVISYEIRIAPNLSYIPI